MKFRVFFFLIIGVVPLDNEISHLEFFCSIFVFIKQSLHYPLLFFKMFSGLGSRFLYLQRLWFLIYKTSLSDPLDSWAIMEEGRMILGVEWPLFHKQGYMGTHLTKSWVWPYEPKENLVMLNANFFGFLSQSFLRF